MSNELPEINYNKPIWKLFPEKELRARAGRCADCNERVVLEDFRDATSLREYTISGLCARCQDAVFG